MEDKKEAAREFYVVDGVLRLGREREADKVGPILASREYVMGWLDRVLPRWTYETGESQRRRLVGHQQQ